MKVAIKDIPAEGLHLNIAENGSELQTIAGKTDFCILSPVSADIALFKTDEEIIAQGSMAALLILQCSRCLKEFEYKISSKIENIYTLMPEQGIKERGLTRKDAGINYLEGSEIDINAFLFEQLSLDMPMQPVCKSDCKGLCPRCGADRNTTPCDCREEGDARLAKLKSLLA
ncbi:MAG: DUF177 domain-containing protein [Deltaproteobacteria bacterium]|nr:DUF177 domain-containing protein [Deltaproteobacteria bacterium]